MHHQAAYLRLSRLLKWAFSGVLLLLMVRFSYQLTAGYEGYYRHMAHILYLPGALAYIDKFLPKVLYYTVCITVPLASLLLLFRLIIAMAKNSPVISRFENKPFDAVASALYGSLRDLQRMSRTNRLLLISVLAFQFIAVLYFIVTLPYHTDEAFSYTYFSGRGLLPTMILYHQPNNHIFYNIVSGVFALLPIDPIIAVRLPNVFIGLISGFYFFKLAKKLQAEKTAIISTSLFCFSFPVMFYGFQARGYALITLFSVLILYSIISIAQNADARRYLFFYAVCAILGFYTIPTFLYFMLPAGASLLFLFVKRKDLRMVSFIKIHAVIAGVTILLYTPIIARNGISALVTAKGVASIKTYEYIQLNILNHLSDTWGFLVNTGYLPMQMVLLLVALLLLISFRRPFKQRFAILLIIAYLLSPPVIIYLHKVIPFARTWIFLVIPLALAIGILLDWLSNVFAIDKLSNQIRAVVCCIFLYLSMPFFAVKAKQGHRSMLGIDFIVRDYMRLLNDKLYNDVSIQRTDDFSFYFTDDLEYEVFKRGYEAKVKMLQAGDSITADILVTGNPSTQTAPANYVLIPLDSTFFKVYLRKEL